MLPSRNPELRLISWTSEPTYEQRQLIENGATALPATGNEEHERHEQEACYIFRRGQHGVQIMHRAVVELQAIGNLALMCTCNQFGLRADLIRGKHIRI